MNYITLFPIFGSRRSQWIFCFRAEHLCFSPWFKEQFFSLKLVCGWFTVTHFVLAAGTTSKASCTVWSGLCLSKLWAWSCTESGGARLIPGPHQSASWHQSWSVAAFLLRVHPHTCEKFHELFYFQFFLTFHHGLHVPLHFWCFLGILWFGSVGLFFLCFF